MMPLDATVLIRDWPGRCPCGAAAARRYGLCAKCQARAAWKRRKAPARHRARQIARRARRLLPAPRTPRPAVARAAEPTR